MTSGKTAQHKPDLPSLIEQYFCDYLMKQRNASPETISSYRDAFCLFLRFSEQQFGKKPAALTLVDFDAPQVLAFLEALEKQCLCSCSKPECPSGGAPIVSPVRRPSGTGHLGNNQSYPRHPGKALRPCSGFLSFT
jgi:hypothetical protein